MRSFFPNRHRPLPRRAAFLLLPICATLSACSSIGVQPWERDLLAKPSMALDADPLETSVDNHLYFSKEASSGGQGFAGGGCGCN